RQIGDMTHLAERLGEVVGSVAIVFDDQETHDEAAVSRDVPRGGNEQGWADHSDTVFNCRDGRTAKLPSQPAGKCEGRRVDPPPLNRPRPGGGDGCRNEIRPEWGRAIGPSPWFEPPAGATDAGGAPHLLRLCRRAVRRTWSPRPTSPA